MNKKKYITDAPGAPAAIGPYSQAVWADNLLFLSGQIPLHPETGEIITGNIEAQADRVMENLQAVLSDAGLDFSHVVKTTILLTDLNDFQTVNETYSKWLGDHRPARATYQVAALPRGVNIEIEMIAAS